MEQQEPESINIQEVIDRIDHLEEIIKTVIAEDEQLEDINMDDIKLEENENVIISSKAYLKLASHAIEFAHEDMDRKNWVEIIGMLTGKIINEDTPMETILVNDYWPIASGDGVSVNIMEAKPIMDVFEKKQSDEFIVGWAHSHPSYTPFMSSDDIATHVRYQRLWGKSIAIVIDPEMITPDSHGFGTFRLYENFEDYYELNSKVDGLTTRAGFDAICIIESQIEPQK